MIYQVTYRILIANMMKVDGQAMLQEKLQKQKLVDPIKTVMELYLRQTMQEILLPIGSLMLTVSFLA
jgi:hypothetical protein